MKAPKAKSEVVSRVMRANKGKDTKPELIVRKAIWAAGYRGYRTSWKKAPGRPDIAFVGKKVAIIVHGCFWHGCPTHYKKAPKTNQKYWTWKINTNRKRDERNAQGLKAAGWKSFTVWEHDVKKRNFKPMLSWLENITYRESVLGKGHKR